MEEQNENNENSIKKKSSEIKLIIEKYQKNLEELQNKCEHKPILKLIIENGCSSKVLRIVCDNCDKIIGYPSNEDKNNLTN
jgi:hypothetical protein